MIRVIVTVTLLPTLAFAVKQNSCPKKYLRLSSEHTYCRPENTKCDFVSKGLLNEKAEIAEILKIHNEYRSKVAIGEEKSAGGLQQASNMLEMTWDDELAIVAQKWADQCNFKHDCNECRSVRSFATGQNLAYNDYYCKDFKCEIQPSDWKDPIGRWYSEVEKYHKSSIPKWAESGKGTGHFTQIIWAETYKVGCGYVSYRVSGEDGEWIRQYHVCNYGPGGNMENAPVYKEGPRCTDCPENSCCDKTCKGKSYPGLCKLSDRFPVHQRKPNILYHCHFQKGDPSCEYDSVDGSKWKFVKTSGGNFLSVVVKERQSAIVHFRNPFKSKSGACMIFTIRKGPNVAGEMDNSLLEVEFEQNGQKDSMQILTFKWPDFIEAQVQLSYNGEVKFSVKMSVPAGVPPQYIDIKEIEVTEEPCKYGY